jgi:predicted DCC family thiol-disulfide oxidoreductase YuxK
MAEVTVWFDGGCPLCVREMALMRRLDRRGAIVFVDLAGVDAVCPRDRSELLSRLHASERGVMLSGAAAFAAMWRAIPVLRPLGMAAKHPLVLCGLERAYLAFLRVRLILQRLFARIPFREAPLP